VWVGFAVDGAALSAGRLRRNSSLSACTPSATTKFAPNNKALHWRRCGPPRHPTSSRTAAQNQLSPECSSTAATLRSVPGRPAVAKMHLVSMYQDNWLQQSYPIMNSFDLGSSIRGAKLQMKIAKLASDEPARIGSDCKLSITNNVFGALLQIVHKFVIR